MSKLQSTLNMSNMEEKTFVPTTSGLLHREIFGTGLARQKQNLVGHRVAHSQSLFKRDLRGHFGCVNAIEFSKSGDFIVSGGDDRRLLLWGLGRTIFDGKEPEVIETAHISNINSCCFDALDRKIATGGNDGQVIVHDFEVKKSTSVCGLSDAIYCLSPDPINSTILATASDDGKAQILDLREPADQSPFVLAECSASMHSIMYNPVDPRILVTANSKQGIALWDIRMPNKSLNYKSHITNCMSARFNSRGDKLLVLRRRACPVLFDIGKAYPMFEFDYMTYYNACTLKSCCFAGLNDEYVVSGSDDFCIYLWKVPSNNDTYSQQEPHMILKGHRSIVNQVRYCPVNQILISSGVEKLIKMWTPYHIPGSSGQLVHSRRYGDDEEVERNAYSHEEYINMVLQAGSFLSHDYSNGSTEEEPCMIAFFDSLIQREVEQSVSEDSKESSSGEGHSDGDGRNNRSRDLAASLGDGLDDGGGGDDDGGGGGGSGGVGRVAGSRTLKRVPSDAVLTVSGEPGHHIESEDANSTRDTLVSLSSRHEESTRPFFMEVVSSSDSDSEVDEILSAMYSRYMSSQERAFGSNSGPSGKKISSVIARGKQRDKASKRKACPRKLQRIREDLQHSGDQFLRDNATSMSILADVIDNFVDNLVASDSNNSRALSDTNDGGLSTDSTSVLGPQRDRDNSSNVLAQETITLTADPTPSVSSEFRAPQPPVSLDSGVYFMPELKAFSPDSYRAVVNADTAGGSRAGPTGSTVPNISSSRLSQGIGKDTLQARVKKLRHRGLERNPTEFERRGISAAAEVKLGSNYSSCSSKQTDQGCDEFGQSSQSLQLRDNVVPPSVSTRLSPPLSGIRGEYPLGSVNVRNGVKSETKGKMFIGKEKFVKNGKNLNSTASLNGSALLATAPPELLNKTSSASSLSSNGSTTSSAFFGSNEEGWASEIVENVGATESLAVMTLTEGSGAAGLPQDEKSADDHNKPNMPSESVVMAKEMACGGTSADNESEAIFAPDPGSGQGGVVKFKKSRGGKKRRFRTRTHDSSSDEEYNNTNGLT